MIPGKHNGPGWGDRTVAGNSLDHKIPRGTDIRAQRLGTDYLEQITLRAVCDALAQATAGYWERRADVLEDARPRPGDWHGQASREAIQARYDRLTLEAEQCRLHAQLFDHDAINLELVAEILGWPVADAVAEAITGEAAAEGVAA